MTVTITRTLIAAALAGAAAAAAAGPATAQPDAWFAGADGGDTTLSRAGGGTYTLEGCDTERDGYGAIAQVFNSSGKEVARARDVGGADNGCAVTRRIAGKRLGRDIHLRITVKDHDGSEGPKGRVKDAKVRFIRLF
jgi:hypothetical protein